MVDACFMSCRTGQVLAHLCKLDVAKAVSDLDAWDVPQVTWPVSMQIFASNLQWGREATRNLQKGLQKALQVTFFDSNLYPAAVINCSNQSVEYICMRQLEVSTMHMAITGTCTRPLKEVYLHSVTCATNMIIQCKPWTGTSFYRHRDSHLRTPPT